MSNNGPRFQARKESRHSCCHDAMVVDTSVREYGDHRQVCECDTIETAIIIAHALNRDAMS